MTLDLPAPDRMRGQWAAVAAVCAATGSPDMAYADGARWHYDDAGGNWGDLVHLGPGRAVLLGNDHEYSETYFRDAATYFGEEETDLLAGAPAWWEAPVVEAMAREEWVGFVYGYDGTWVRADYDLPDGFGSLGHPGVNRADCLELVAQFAGDPDPASVVALVGAGSEVSPELLGSVVGSAGDVDAGVAAARRFRG
jgi:hypothetical protein